MVTLKLTEAEAEVLTKALMGMLAETTWPLDTERLTAIWRKLTRAA